MTRIRYTALSFIAFLFAAISLQAQTGTGGGCVNSPEAPTVFLMLIGAVGMFYGSFVLRKVICRNSKR